MRYGSYQHPCHPDTRTPILRTLCLERPWGGPPALRPLLAIGRLGSPGRQELRTQKELVRPGMYICASWQIQLQPDMAIVSICYGQGCGSCSANQRAAGLWEKIQVAAGRGGMARSSNLT